MRRHPTKTSAGGHAQGCLPEPGPAPTAGGPARHTSLPFAKTVAAEREPRVQAILGARARRAFGGRLARRFCLEVAPALAPRRVGRESPELGISLDSHRTRGNEARADERVEQFVRNVSRLDVPTDDAEERESHRRGGDTVRGRCKKVQRAPYWIVPVTYVALVVRVGRRIRQVRATLAVRGKSESLEAHSIGIIEVDRDDADCLLREGRVEERQGFGDLLC